MRITRLLLVFSASMIFAAPASAQQSPAPAPAPTRSVDDYLCTFAGECGKQPGADESIEAPETKGFRISVSDPTGADTRETTKRSGVTAGNKQRTAGTGGGQARSRASATQPRRMDLRVSFLLGSAELTPQAQEEVKVFAKALQRPELAARRFLIAGHTDSSGSRAMNLDLSRRRAQSVADYLAGQGVQSSRLQVRGYGPDRPLQGHRRSSPENRRVEAQLL